MFLWIINVSPSGYRLSIGFKDMFKDIEPKFDATRIEGEEVSLVYYLGTKEAILST